MLKVRQLIIGILSIGISFSAYGLTEWEWRELEKFSLPSVYSTYSFDKELIDFSRLSVPPAEYSPPLSLNETRSKIKQRLALQINPQWQVGFDSFRAFPLDRSIIDWPAATQPKGSKLRSHKGYGVGVRMKLD